MRAILVGTPAGRARLRAALAGSVVEIVGETASIGLARQSAADVDVWIVEPERTQAFRGGRPPDLVDPLTVREVDVLNLVAQGLPNKAIAERLSISDQTVKFHLASIMSKLGAHNRTEAVRLGVRRGLITI